MEKVLTIIRRVVTRFYTHARERSLADRAVADFLGLLERFAARAA